MSLRTVIPLRGYPDVWRSVHKGFFDCADILDRDLGNKIHVPVKFSDENFSCTAWAGNEPSHKGVTTSLGYPCTGPTLVHPQAFERASQSHAQAIHRGCG